MGLVNIYRSMGPVTPSSNGTAAFFLSFNEHGVSTFFRAAAEMSRHYFFSSTKTSFLRHKVLSEYLFLPKSETDIFPHQIC